MQEILSIVLFDNPLSEVILKEDYQKAWKKVTLFSPSNPVPFNRQNFQKQKWAGTKDQSLFRLQNKFRKNLLLVMYYLTKIYVLSDQGFWVILKIKSANLCKPIHGTINYSTSICLFKYRKCGKEGNKLQKFDYLEKKKNFLDETKTCFVVLEGLSVGKKIKIWWKFMDTSFKH